ncbi:hypothetical protein D3C72_2214650 [compost metagenome]
MRSVCGTAWKPAYMFSASGHSTEWTSTKTRLLVPSPNHSSASGSSAIAGSGLNMAVSVSSISRPKRVDTASEVSTKASTMPAA